MGPWKVLVAAKARRLPGRPLHHRAVDAPDGPSRSRTRGHEANDRRFPDRDPKPLDLVKRVFHADRPNQLWVADFTYVVTWVGCVYVAFVIDVFSRMIVGWRAAKTMTADWTLDALAE